MLGYGYTQKEDCEAVISQYRNAGIPLDGLHIDVDLQVSISTQWFWPVIYRTWDQTNRTGNIGRLQNFYNQ